MIITKELQETEQYKHLVKTLEMVGVEAKIVDAALVLSVLTFQSVINFSVVFKSEDDLKLYKIVQHNDMYNVYTRVEPYESC